MDELPIRQESRECAIRDPFQPREGNDLTWKNVNMNVTISSPASWRERFEGGKKTKPSTIQKKTILKNAYGKVPRGEVTAIMGPSGCGKTSLLNVLAGRTATRGNVEVKANIWINGIEVDPTDIRVRQQIAFCAQDDSLPAMTTPREAIRFSARLRMPARITDTELESLVDSMLEELDLTDCADTIVGSLLQKGISGGQRKRTSVGVDLVTSPSLAFLDEPTSGLDSYNAEQLCRVLKKVAHSGSSVLCTIHQPSSDIFELFDSLILLCVGGKVMYQGPATGVLDHFEACGYPLPPNYSTADWILDVCMSNTRSELSKAGFFSKEEEANTSGYLDVAAKMADQGPSMRGVQDGTKDSIKTGDDDQVGLLVQTKLLLGRDLTSLIRDKEDIKARMGTTMTITLCSALLFFQVAKDDFGEFIYAQSTLGASVTILVGNLLSVVLPCLPSVPQERPIFLREYSTNHYSVMAYFVSRLIMEVSLTCFQITLSVIIVYFSVGFSANFLSFWSGVFLMGTASNAMGVLVGYSVDDVNIATEFMGPILLPQVLLMGFYISPQLIPGWLLWLRYLCPLTYGINILIAAEFGHGRCDENVTGEEEGNSAPTSCDLILQNQKVSVDDVWWYYLAVIGIFVVIRLLALWVLKRRASNTLF